VLSGRYQDRKEVLMDRVPKKIQAEPHFPTNLPEQRRYVRIKMIIGLTCHRLGAQDINIFSDNVSPGGIKFTTHAHMNRGEEVELDLPVEPGQYTRVAGKLAWFRKGANSCYEGGIEFEMMDDAALVAWGKFIERNVEKK